MTKYYRNHYTDTKVYSEPLRIGTVAKICRVTNKTIFNWIQQGALKSFTTHGGHNRIWPAELRSFFDRESIDIGFEFDDKRQTRFLIVNDRPAHRKLLLDSFCERFPVASVISARGQYEALLLVGETNPDVITWDLNMPRFDGARMIKFLQARRMNECIHVTLHHHLDDEILDWRAYVGSSRHEKMRTGLPELMNSLDGLLVTPSSPQRTTVDHPAQVTFPHFESPMSSLVPQIGASPVMQQTRSTNYPLIPKD